MILPDIARLPTQPSLSKSFKIEVTEEPGHKIILRCFRAPTDYWQTWQKICRWQRSSLVPTEATLILNGQVICQQRLSIPTAQSSNRVRSKTCDGDWKKRVYRKLEFK